MAAAKRLRTRSEAQAPQSHVMKRWDKDRADRQQKDHADVICALPSPSQVWLFHTKYGDPDGREFS